MPTVVNREKGEKMVDAAQAYNEHAEEWSLRLASGNNHAHSLLEKPAMAKLLPDLSGKKILAIGCGSGEELALLLYKGARQADIVGIDVSEGLISTAGNNFPEATFHVCPMEDLSRFADQSFDMVYSSLTMHYAEQWQPILAEVKRVLKRAGNYLFSTHHPIKWGSLVSRTPSEDTFTMGYIRPKAGEPTVNGDYLGTRRIDDVWFGNMTVSYYHRPLGAIMADILASGLRIQAFVEPPPVPQALDIAPGFHAIHSKIPLFMIFDLVSD
jgi:ubiquinone/menaquinone biosynthesis C-methylase UbiE